jgi:hypothetical protein
MWDNHERQKGDVLLLGDQPRLCKVVLEMLYAAQCHNTVSLGRTSAERLLLLVHGIDVWVKGGLRTGFLA